MRHPIKKEKLQVIITERGSLEPADSNYFTCKVKAKDPGQNSTSIRWVIDNGTSVKKGDLLLELDDSALRDQLIEQEILFYEAEQLWQQADLDREINRLTNEALVATAKAALETAKIAKKEYLEGQYEQLRIDLENKLIMARSDLTMWQERAGWSDRMSRPGRQYIPVAQAEADAARFQTAKLTLKNLSTQHEVLKKLTREMQRITLQGAIDTAEVELKKAQRTLKKTLEKDEVAVKATYAKYQKELARMQDIQKEIDNCLIFAPRDGMVVYYVDQRARWGRDQGAIDQGELVKEGQKLLGVPDLSRLVVKAKIHEAMVSRVIDDEEKATGFSEAVNTSLLFGTRPLCALSAYLAFDLDRQSAFSKAYSHLEKKQERRGMDAIVTANAFPDRPLKAHVKAVAPVASQVDFFNADVKVYETAIAIDDDRLQGLKPGMDAVVTIFVDSTPEPVLTIPLQALMGGVAMGAKRRCFVLVEDRPEMREITLGMTNETVAEVKEGLEEGDVVVLNPAALLSDKEKVEYGVSAPSDQGGRGRPGAGRGGPGGGKGKGKGGGWKGKGKGGQRGGPGGGFGGGRRSEGGGAPSTGKKAANP